MGKSLTIMEARKMNTHKIVVDLEKHTSQLEKLGMDHADAYHFIIGYCIDMDLRDGYDTPHGLMGEE